MRSLIIGLFAGLVTLWLSELAVRTQQPAATTADGWKRLRPGWFLHGILIGAAGLGALMAWFLLSGGSSRTDAELQNAFAFGIAAVFAGAALHIAWTVHGRTIEWKDDVLRVRTRLGRDIEHRMFEVRWVTRSVARGEYKLTLADGSTLHLSAYLHGSNELVAKLPRRTRRELDG